MSKSSSSIEVRTSAPSTTSILDIALLSNQKVLPNEIFQPWKVPPASHQQRHDIYAMTAVRPSAPSTSSSLGIQPRPYYDIFHRTSAPSTSSILGIQPRPYYESQAETFQPWPVPPAYLQQRHDIFAMRPHHLMTAVRPSAPSTSILGIQPRHSIFRNESQAEIFQPSLKPPAAHQQRRDIIVESEPVNLSTIRVPRQPSPSPHHPQPHDQPQRVQSYEQYNIGVDPALFSTTKIETKGKPYIFIVIPRASEMPTIQSLERRFEIPDPASPDNTAPASTLALPSSSPPVIHIPDNSEDIVSDDI